MSEALRGAFAGRRALLTGASGFTGPYVRARLEQAGAAVTGLYRPGERGAPGDLACEITDAAALREAVARVAPDYVVHLAAISFVPFADADAMVAINVHGTRNLLEACVAPGVAPRKLVLVSSANVYGNAPLSPITEDAPLAPANEYAHSKCEVERLAAAWQARLPILIARPFNYTGVGQDEKFIVPKLVAAFRHREPEIALGRTDVVRDFSDVRWVAEAYARLLASDLRSEVFNLCSGIGTSVDMILAMLARLSGHAPRITVNEEFMRANEIERLVGSPARLRAALGPFPSIPLEDTLAWMYHSAPAQQQVSA